MEQLPLDFEYRDEIHLNNSRVVSLSEFPIDKPIYSLAIRFDSETHEMDVKLLYRTELPPPLPDDPYVRPGGRELRSKAIAISAQGPNVDFHFSSIKDMEKFFTTILREAKKLAE